MTQLCSTLQLHSSPMRVGRGDGGKRAGDHSLNDLLPHWADNEETEGSDVPADYLLGDVEGEDDELYPLDTEHVHRE